MSAYEKPEPGQWYRLGRHSTIACCDCGLVHRVETKLRRGRIWQRAWRSEAQTGGKRAAKKRMRQGVFARSPR